MRHAEYEENVFINCPFDADYSPIFEAIVFAVTDAGFRATIAASVPARRLSILPSRTTSVHAGAFATQLRRRRSFASFEVMGAEDTAPRGKIGFTAE